jgi:DNA-binding cell septation regulator SpoVG
MTSIVIKEFKSLPRNSLRGFARVRLPSGMVIHDVSIFYQNGTRSASPPSKPAITRDGTVFKKDGKVVYTPIITFTSKEVRDKFSDAIIAAIASTNPEALT